ncbi:MAG: DUF488 domain-containing protein [candidate division KSB1 bacterium]|nr:DUF488 domain-containing protein [candidate division KSB1 bacterium]MDZ7358330.1 DUF488 domain-containing protein [candidate division KSB1 bacterium]MDZ7399131.1 DUF488 domain-containing protein [candidate division KSB1 bacterium]
MSDIKKTIYSIGHSTHPIEHFLYLLQRYGIEVIADVRRFPSSKSNPQYQLEQLKCELARSGVEYHWLGDALGGFRNGGYLEYMKSESFLKGIEQLTSIAESKRTAIMCAEKLFFRCHRRFIADHLVLLGWRVIHVLDENKSYPHISSNTIIMQL